MKKTDELKLNRALKKATIGEAKGLDFFADLDMTKPPVEKIFAAVNVSESGAKISATESETGIGEKNDSENTVEKSTENRKISLQPKTPEYEISEPKTSEREISESKTPEREISEPKTPEHPKPKRVKSARRRKFRYISYAATAACFIVMIASVGLAHNFGVSEMSLTSEADKAADSAAYDTNGTAENNSESDTSEDKAVTQYAGDEQQTETPDATKEKKPDDNAALSENVADEIPHTEVDAATLRLFPDEDSAPPYGIIALIAGILFITLSIISFAPFLRSRASDIIGGSKRKLPGKGKHNDNQKY
jgi:hypothetical protein